MTKLREAVSDSPLRERNQRRKRDLYHERRGGGRIMRPALEGLQVGQLPAGSGASVTVAGHSVLEVKEGPD